MGTCEGRDSSCDWFSRVAHTMRTGCILPRELRWFKEWFKAQCPGVLMSEALWDTPRAWKALYKNGLLLLLLLRHFHYYLVTPMTNWADLPGKSVANTRHKSPPMLAAYFKVNDKLTLLSSSMVKHVFWKWRISRITWAICWRKKKWRHISIIFYWINSA